MSGERFGPNFGLSSALFIYITNRKKKNSKKKENALARAKTMYKSMLLLLNVVTISHKI